MSKTGDEARQSPNGDADWVETLRLVCWSEPPGALALATQISFDANGEAGFQAAVFRPGSPPIVIAENEIDPSSTWEVRASGLWADHNCEQEFVHWSFGLEAFGLEIDDPKELLGKAHGNRVPLGWELDFIADLGDLESQDTTDKRSYTQSGVVEGLLLLASGELELPKMFGWRQHRWGTQPAEAADVVGLSQPAQVVYLPSLSHIWKLNFDGFELESNELTE